MHCENYNATFFMMNRHNIASGIWLIDSEYAQGYLPLVTNFLKGNNRNQLIEAKSVPELTERNSIKIFNPTSGIYNISEYGDRVKPESAPQNSIAVIDIADVITKYDQDCGPAGMVTKSNLLKRCYQTNNIDAIVLKIDSGGGEGYAMFHLCETIAERNKPVYAFVSDFCASAAYGIASGCDSIYVNMDLAKVGSIGAYTTLIDYKNFFERQGVKIHEIYAAQSKDKNIEFKEAVKGNYAPMQKMLTVFTEKFITMVYDNRKDKLKADKKVWNTGKTMYASEAIEIGLMDKIATWDEALNEIESNIKINNSQPMKKQPLNLNSVLNVEQLESTTEGVYLNEQQISTIDEHLSNQLELVQTANTEKTNAETAKQTAETEKAEVEEKLNTANADITAKQTRINELELQVENLKNNAGGDSRRVVKEVESNGGEQNDNDAFMNNLENARNLYKLLPD